MKTKAKTKAKMLKVKIKSLAEEARIIRKEEGRCGKDEALRSSLHAHRILDVRGEQRASLLAYAFIRGREYASVEGRCRAQPDWGRVQRLVGKFGRCSQYGWPVQGSEAITQMAEFEAWKSKEKSKERATA